MGIAYRLQIQAVYWNIDQFIRYLNTWLCSYPAMNLGYLFLLWNSGWTGYMYMITYASTNLISICLTAITFPYLVMPMYTLPNEPYPMSSPLRHSYFYWVDVN